MFSVRRPFTTVVSSGRLSGGESTHSRAMLNDYCVALAALPIPKCDSHKTVPNGIYAGHVLMSRGIQLCIFRLRREHTPTQVEGSAQRMWKGALLLMVRPWSQIRLELFLRRLLSQLLPFGLPWPLRGDQPVPGRPARRGAYTSIYADTRCTDVSGHVAVEGHR